MKTRIIILLCLLTAAFSIAAKITFSKQLLDRATAGDAAAQASLGNCYYNGAGIEKDLKKGYEWSLKSAEQGNARGLCWVGFYYLTGQYVEKDLFTAFKYFERSMATGDTIAKSFLDKSNLYEDRFGYQLITQAENGDPEAQFYLALSFVHSDIRTKYEIFDRSLCFQWMKKCADNGYLRAMYEVGEMYRSGTGTTKDIAKSAIYYRQAAEKGFAPAQCVYGQLLANGAGVQKDNLKAISWLKKSAENGEGNAMSVLGNYYRDGYAGLAKDINSAIKWYKKGAEANSPHAMVSLGYCYFQGTGVEKDLFKAVECWGSALNLGSKDAVELIKANASQITRKFPSYFKKLKQQAENGDPNSQAYVAQCYTSNLAYRSGVDLSEPHIEGFKWVKRAAENGYENYYFLMGYIYETGNILIVSKDMNPSAYNPLRANEQHNVTNRDLMKAAEFYNRSIMSNDIAKPYAKIRMAKAYYNSDDNLAKVDYDKCVQLLLSAVTELEKATPTYELVEAYKMLSKCYRLGRGVNADENKADEYSNKIEKLGSVSAYDVNSVFSRMRALDKN